MPVSRIETKSTRLVSLVNMDGSRNTARTVAGNPGSELKLAVSDIFSCTTSNCALTGNESVAMISAVPASATGIETKKPRTRISAAAELLA